MMMIMIMMMANVKYKLLILFFIFTVLISIIFFYYILTYYESNNRNMNGKKKFQHFTRWKEGERKFWNRFSINWWLLRQRKAISHKLANSLRDISRFFFLFMSNRKRVDQNFNRKSSKFIIYLTNKLYQSKKNFGINLWNFENSIFLKSI